MMFASGLAKTRNTVFIAVGIVTLLFSVVLNRTEHPDIHEFLVALGVVIILVSILELLFILGGGNPVEQKISDLSVQLERLSKAINIIERADRVGLVGMHDCTGNYGAKDQWFELMHSAKASMDLMGRSLYEWIRAPDLDALMVKKIVIDNVHFRWLIMDSKNTHLNQLEEDGRLIGESISKKIGPVCERLEAIRARLPVEKRVNLELRTFSNVPLYCSMLRIDETYLITPYLQSVASRNSPLLILEGRSSPWAIAYDREFEVLWSGSSPCPRP